MLPDLAAVVGEYRKHRLVRLAAVEAAVAAVGDDLTAVTDAVYTDIDASVRPAAEKSVAAQLEYLRSR